MIERRRISMTQPELLPELPVTKIVPSQRATKNPVEVVKQYLLSAAKRVIRVCSRTAATFLGLLPVLM